MAMINYWQKDIETMKRPELEALQLERLRYIVAYCYERVPFYRKRFDDIGPVSYTHLVFACNLSISTAIFLLHRPIMGLFTSSTEIIDMSMPLFALCIFINIGRSFNHSFNYGLRASGYVSVSYTHLLAPPVTKAFLPFRLIFSRIPILRTSFYSWLSICSINLFCSNFLDHTTESTNGSGDYKALPNIILYLPNPVKVLTAVCQNNHSPEPFAI